MNTLRCLLRIARALFVASLGALASYGASIAVGGHHVYVLKSDGRVWSWGYNSSGGVVGALGDGTAVDRPTPVLIAALSAVIRVDAGQDHGIALRSDGTVWTWGGGGFGQIGNSKTVDQLVPVAVTTLSGVSAIAAGQIASYAVKSDGTLWSWGDNRNGQLGIGTTTTQTKPVKVAALSGIKSVSAGAYFAAALGLDGRVWTWGANQAGQLGSGSTAARSAPGQVLGLPVIVDLKVGSDFCLALDQQGQVWVWGTRTALGDGGSSAYRTTAGVVAGLPVIQAIFAGTMTTVARAVSSTGEVYAWGTNDRGQTQPPAGTDILLPRLYSALAGAISLAGSAPSVAVLADGRVRTWGIGAGDFRAGDATTPLGTSLLLESMKSGFARSATGDNYTLAIDPAGQLWAHGANEAGQLGIGSTTAIRGYVGVVPLGAVTQAKAMNSGSGALSADGKLWFWGSNYSGRFGDGSIASRTSPASVTSLPAIKGFDLGYAHAVAVATNGEVWSWGANGYGQTGTAPTPTGYNPLPAKVTGVSNATAVAAGRSHSLALLTNGTVAWWGMVAGVTTYTPAIVSRLTGVTKIAGGDEFSVALLTDGTVSTWGLNNSGQLGNGSTTNSSRPVAVSGLTGIVEVAASNSHAIALRNDGTAWRWGDGVLTPVRVGTVAGIKGISGGGSLGIVAQDGRIWTYSTFGNALDGLLRQVADFRAIPAADDSDSDGLPDVWEMLKFGTLSRTAAGDDDSDGLSNVQELALQSDPRSSDSDRDSLPDWMDLWPLDFYNGEKPSLAIISGNNQNAPPGQFATNALDVAVWDARGVAPLSGAPVTFTVMQGGGLLSAAKTGSPLVSTASVLTDGDGTAQLFYREPSGANVTSDVQVTAGAAQVHFVSTSGFIDTDSNGLPDTWEIQYFGSVGVNPTADPDGDGVSNLAEYQQGTDPLDYYNGALPILTSLVANDQPGPRGIVSVRVTKASSGAVLVNAPVVVTVAAGSNPISSAFGAEPAQQVAVRTDAEGVANVYVEGWVLIAPETLIAKPVSGQNATPLTLLLRPPASSDADANGLPDWWEAKYFGQTGVNAGADPDNDGATTLMEYERGTSPIRADPPPTAPTTLQIFSPLNR